MNPFIPHLFHPAMLQRASLGAVVQVTPGFKRLVSRICKDRAARFFLSMKNQFTREHLKDLVVTDMDDARTMVVQQKRVVNFGSDSFLGLDRDPRIINAIIDGTKRWGSHSGASRAFYSAEVNTRAEQKLAKWLGVESTLIFPSTTLANMGLIPALAGKGDLLVVDRQAHNSVHEASKIAHDNGAVLRELWPCEPQALASLLANEPVTEPIVAVDGVYSMAGFSPPLAALDRVTRQAGGTLYIDDAHGTGIFGPRGRGAAAAELGTLENVIMVGSLSKAFSCLGAFVTCTEELKLLFKMKSQTYLFGGPVPPPYLEGVCAAVEIIDSPEYNQIRARLGTLIDRLVRGLRAMGFIVLGGEAPIISILIKDKSNTLRAGKWLFDRGFYVQSVIYPAVPVNGGVLRIQVNAIHSPEQIDGLLNALADMKKDIPVPSDDVSVN